MLPAKSTEPGQIAACVVEVPPSFVALRYSAKSGFSLAMNICSVTFSESFDHGFFGISPETGSLSLNGAKPSQQQSGGWLPLS